MLLSLTGFGSSIFGINPCDEASPLGPLQRASWLRSMVVYSQLQPHNTTTLRNTKMRLTGS